MKFTKKDLSLEEGLTKEWIITNGIGGYSSSTIIGANTRKYHGLLVAPLTPPARRHLVLSKVDESIEIEGKDYNLYTNICPNYISEGYKNLESFEKEYIPIFTYKLKNIIIKKLICMERGKNTVCILYKIENKNSKNAKLKLAPIINFRDFHQMRTNHQFRIIQKNIHDNKIKLIIDDYAENPVYINLSDGKYFEFENNQFNNMFYIEEEKRGLYPEENHVIPGIYEIDIKPREEKEVSFVCSLEENIEEIDIKRIIDSEIIRINELMQKSDLIDYKKEDNKKKIELIRDYCIAADNFVVYRPSFGLHTLIAGYHWFLDWGRDALISYEGLLLKTKRFDIAKEILLTGTRDIKFGLVPNGYSGFDNRPLYNSADASLLLFEQVNKYLFYTNDFKFIEDNIYDKLIIIIESYIKGIYFDNNDIYMDEDYLISAGNEKTQNTWMDAKYGDFPATPRNGKAVEINSLWYNALKTIETLSLIYGYRERAKKYEDLAKKCEASFVEKFYNPKRKCLFDVIGDKKIRPNQLFSIALTYQVLDPASDIAKEMFETVTKKLLNKYGLKTLATGEEGYIAVYEGDSFKRDMSYHQGITWPWLIGIYSDGFKNIIANEKSKEKKKKLQAEYDEFVENLRKTFLKAFYKDGMIESISELYDSKAPFLPKGTAAQAWSVAEVFRTIL
ncbi:MAG: glycogen debranching enzyme N-terminal domain-containing protein [Clostridia bacterium]|nr:glycogen debranching enzyme N-terminal domain-containing protein [Clostridia bacterium]